MVMFSLIALVHLFHAPSAITKDGLPGRSQGDFLGLCGEGNGKYVGKSGAIERCVSHVVQLDIIRWPMPETFALLRDIAPR